MQIALMAVTAIYLIVMTCMVNAYSFFYMLMFKVIPPVLAFCLAVVAVAQWQHWPLVV